MASFIKIFFVDRRGNFGVIFVFMSVVLMGAIGLFIDYSNLSNIHSHMQNASDAAALAAARERGKSETERRAIAVDVFNANFTSNPAPTLNVTFPNGTVRVDAKVAAANLFGVFTSQRNSVVGVTSSANAGPPQTIEIAFALDVSGSMGYTLPGSPSRLAALQSAVDSVLDQMEAAAAPNVTIKAALVPFTNAVNIGTSNARFVMNTSHPLFTGTSWVGCVFERPQPETFSDTAAPKWGAYIYPPMPNVLAQRDYADNRSNGTMNGYATLAEDPTSTNSRLSGPNFNCTRYPIVPLTTDLDTIRDAVSSYVVWSNMGTHIAAGVSWGMRVLSPQQPFSEGAAYTKNVHKILVVVTDGEQVTDAEGTYGLAKKSTNSVAPWQFDPAAFGLPGKAINNGFGPADSFGAYGFVRELAAIWRYRHGRARRVGAKPHAACNIIDDGLRRGEAAYRRPPDRNLHTRHLS